MPRGEGIMIEGWEIQFLPPTSGLDKEAIAAAITLAVGEIPIRVFTQEHLIAICLNTNRPKDQGRLIDFTEAGSFDESRLIKILNRHGLTERWNQFKQRFFHAETHQS